MAAAGCRLWRLQWHRAQVGCRGRSWQEAAPGAVVHFSVRWCQCSSQCEGNVHLSVRLCQCSSQCEGSVHLSVKVVPMFISE